MFPTNSGVNLITFYPNGTLYTKSANGIDGYGTYTVLNSSISFIVEWENEKIRYYDAKIVDGIMTVVWQRNGETVSMKGTKQ